MIQAHYTLKTAMMGNQRSIDVISNNIANAGNDGFKKSSIKFSELMTETFDKVYPDNVSTNYKIGGGVSSENIIKDFQQGSIEKSDKPLDLAIEGEGFFTVVNDKGEVYFTRGGSFETNVRNGVNYLTDSNGRYVINQNGNRIAVSGNETDISIHSDGTVAFLDTNMTNKIQLIRFQNPEALETVGENAYMQTDGAGNMFIDNVGSIRQFAKEGSNVDMASELTELIKAQRLYEVSARVLQTVDQMHSMANNLRR